MQLARQAEERWTTNYIHDYIRLGVQQSMVLNAHGLPSPKKPSTPNWHGTRGMLSVSTLVMDPNLHRLTPNHLDGQGVRAAS